MQILFVTSRLPYPPDRGDRLRVYNFIQHLSCEHELSLVTFLAAPDEQDRVQALDRFCRHVETVLLPRQHSLLSTAANLWRRDPLQVLYYRSQAMHRVIEKSLRDERFDLVYAHLFRMAPYLPPGSHPYRIVDLTDVISQEIVRSLPYRGRVWRLIYSLERPRIERYERLVAETFEETWLISRQDAGLLAGRAPLANLQVVTNGVDTERFFPTGQPCEPARLIFTGHLGVFHNVDAALHLVRDLLPLVRRRLPDCTLQLVGASPATEVRSLAADPAVTVTGYVPDLNAYLNGAALFVAPLRFAAGVQNKVLEAMAAGRPVVTTSVVNAGLGALPGRDLLVADDPAEMAEQIVALLQDEPLRARLGQAGLEFVRRNYTWQKVVERVRALEEVVASRGKAPEAQTAPSAGPENHG